MDDKMVAFSGHLAYVTVTFGQFRGIGDETGQNGRDKAQWDIKFRAMRVR